MKNPSAIHFIIEFLLLLDVKQKTTVCRIGDTKTNFKSTLKVRALCYSIHKHIRHTKPIQVLNKVYNIWFYIIRMLCSSRRPCLPKVSIDGHT